MHHHIANKTSIHSFNPADPKYAWHAAPLSSCGSLLVKKLSSWMS